MKGNRSDQEDLKVTKRERVRKAIAHRQPEKVPWDIVLTDPARAKLVDYYDDQRLAEEEFFSKWVGNHFRSLTPRSMGLFHGGIGGQSTLPLGTPGEVRDNVRRMIKEIGAGGGYILAQAHPDGVLGDVPVKNIVALIEAVQAQ